MSRGRGRLKGRNTWCANCRSKQPARELHLTAKGLLCDKCYNDYQELKTVRAMRW